MIIQLEEFTVVGNLDWELETEFRLAIQTSTVSETMADRKIEGTRGLASGDQCGVGLRADGELISERKRHIFGRWMWTQIGVEMEVGEEFEENVKRKVRPDEEEGMAGREAGG